MTFFPTLSVVRENIRVIRLCMIVVIALIFSAQVNGQHVSGQGGKPPMLGNPKERVAYYTREINLNENNAESYFQRGKAYYDAGNHWFAYNDYSKAIVIDSTFAEAYNYRAICLQFVGESEEALYDWNKAVSLQPTNADYLNNRAKQLAELGDTLAALTDLDKAITLKPNYIGPFMNKIVILFDKKDSEKEVYSSILKVIELDSTSSFGYYYLGLFHGVKRNDMNAAIQAFDKAIQFDPAKAELYFKRGLAKNTKKDYKGGLKDYTKGISLLPENDPDLVWYYNDRGLVYYYLEQYENAEKDFAKAISLMPDFAEALHNHGAILAILGKKTEGCKELEKAKALGHPKSQEAMDLYCK